MQKRYYAAMAVFLGLNAWGILKFSQAPPPKDIMKPSFFDRPEEVGAVVYRRLYGDMGQNDVVLFGVRPNDISHQKLVEGFLATSVQEKLPITVVFRESHLEVPAVPPGTEVIDFEFNSDQSALTEKVRAQTAQGKRVLLYTANTLSSHLIKNNPVERFEAAWGKPVFTISSVDVALRREQEQPNDPPCVGSERDGQGTAALGCAALLKGRSFYRKNIDVSRIVALMDQRGEKDLLLYLSLPSR
jgi:hypothetical protein